VDQYEVIIEPSAEADLNNIYNYITNTLQSKINAKRQIERIQTGIKELAAHIHFFVELDFVNLFVADHLKVIVLLRIPG